MVFMVLYSRNENVPCMSEQEKNCDLSIVGGKIKCYILMYYFCDVYYAN